MRTHFRFLLPLLPGILLAGCMDREAGNVYFENFDQGPGGWFSDRHYALLVRDGVAYCYSPWWTDANHAPPGAGYLHLVMWLYTKGEHYNTGSQLPYRNNSFVEQGQSTNLTGARMTIRLRGEVELKGAQLALLVQAKTPKTTANLVLTGQPFEITREWSEQSATLVADPAQWTCLGARHDMQEVYGCDDLTSVLADVNYDIILILFPLDVVPACGPSEERDRLRAVKDYPVDQARLPKGLIMFDWIRIEYPPHS